MKTSFKTFLTVLTVGVVAAGAALAASDAEHPKQQHWPFDGMTGTVDQQAAQRGLQVYKEVCSSCHGLKRVAFRNLAALGFSEAEIKQLASDYTVMDGPNDEGEMFERAGLPSDKFVPPFPNDKAAAAANGGKAPPDLSLMVKARPDGANYLYSLLTGYADAPAGFDMPEGTYYNPYFAGKVVAMAPPLFSDGVTYQDGTEASVDQMSRDLTVFLQWTAEPEMEQRKAMGLKVLIYLAIMTVLFYIAKKRIWRDITH